ncbi:MULTISPECIES: NUDIX domain-containing protein [Catenuloplanes]|uniref:8-oxo-dGTP diphosphatase n=1 Tax=Catenuloplanes niger TaxID=587534 RepID=A0AAE3ZVV6_9ACTN|nr:8-oxo-dGTP diphosphatase [Catenuloplanes niger]
MNPPIAVDVDGNELLEFRTGHERDLERLDPDVPLPLSLVVGRHQGSTLLVLNRRRGRWELPGGMIDRGETPGAAAVREFVEETGQAAPDVAYIGLAVFRLKPDNRVEYAAVYGAVLGGRTPFEPNDEVEAIRWWDGADIPNLSALDAEICRSLQRRHRSRCGE